MYRLDLTDKEIHLLVLCLSIAYETFEKHRKDTEDHPTISDQFDAQSIETSDLKQKVQDIIDGE